jgi:hypothetical protein
MIDHHALAIISITGSSLDVLGALYLAYDLLGGEHGPLRTLTRGVTYGAIVGIAYGLFFGPIFGLFSGVTHGLTLSWEYSRASRRDFKSRFWYDSAMSSIRAAGFGVGFAFLYGIRFGVAFGILSAVGQSIAYRFGIRPSMDYAPGTRPRLTRHQFLAVINRTVGYTAASYISALIGNRRANALSVAVEVGLLMGAVTAFMSACVPIIEWTADNLAPRRMGVFGIACILTGFSLQSVQYWLSLLDISVR